MASAVQQVFIPAKFPLKFSEVISHVSLMSGRRQAPYLIDGIVVGKVYVSRNQLVS